MPISTKRQESGDMRPWKFCSTFGEGLLQRSQAVLIAWSTSLCGVTGFACDRLPKADCTLLLSGRANGVHQCHFRLQCEHATCQYTAFFL